MTDLSQHSLDQLLALQKNVGAEIDRRRSAEKTKVQQEILALANLHGLSVQFSGAAAKASAAAPKAKREVAPKYRHPADASKTWTGRGRMPAWVAEWKGSHGDLSGVTI